MSRRINQYVHQPDAVISQANPVSTTLYTVLNSVNVKIINICSIITWAVTQPTPLEVIVTIDGQSITYALANPVSTQLYRCMNGGNAPAAQKMVVFDSGGVDASAPTYLLEGKIVKVEARIAWAVTQPTPLACRVKWAKR